MTTVTSRRAILAGVAVVPALSLPALAGPTNDPVIAAVEGARSALELATDLGMRIGGAEEREDTWRPIPLVSWRGYTIGGSEIDDHRDRLLAKGKFKPSTIEREYRAAKAREQELLQAAEDWDKRLGLHEMRAKMEAADAHENELTSEIEKLVPMTLAGAIAVVEYISERLQEDDFDKWQATALSNVVTALRKMAVS